MNTEGQLGQNDQKPGMNSTVPIQVGTDFGWIRVDTGQGDTCAIRSPGTLHCWGRNTAANLGLGPGSPVQIRAPTQVGTDDDWARIAVGQDHTCATKIDGTLWCWGANEAGQLGLGDQTPRDTPTRIGAGADWTDIRINTFHSCGMKTDGSIWCWGRNIEGQLGVGDINDRETPAESGVDRDWSEVAAGRFFTCATKRSGSIWCAGKNEVDELGVGDMNRRNLLSRTAVP
jgi:hypothetical protein